MQDKKEGTRQKVQQGSKPAERHASLMEVQEKLGLFRPLQPEQATVEHKFLERKPLGFI